jgi:non-ribosomal peptide synthetase component E (peptide arylation enzyme)
MCAQGWWQDKTADDLLESAIRAIADKKAIVAYRDPKAPEIIDVMPGTACGEIQKFILREKAQKYSTA